MYHATGGTAAYFRHAQSPLHRVVMSQQFAATPVRPLQKYLNDAAGGVSKGKNAPLPPNIVRDIANVRSDIGAGVSDLCAFINKHLAKTTKVRIKSMADKVKLLLQLKAHVNGVDPSEQLNMCLALVDKEEPTYDMVYGGEVAVFAGPPRRPPLHAVVRDGAFKMSFSAEHLGDEVLAVSETALSFMNWAEEHCTRRFAVDEYTAIEAAMVALRRARENLSAVNEVNFSAVKRPSIDDVRCLGEILGRAPHVTVLRLEDANIGDNQAEALADIVETNTHLKALNLQENDVTDDGAEMLAAALETNTTLELLNLQENAIGDDGAEMLAKALVHNQTLQTLVLHGNTVGDDGASALAEALPDSKLRAFSLHGNYIGDEGVLNLANALKTNTSLQHLDLQSNDVGPEGCAALAAALADNTTLQALWLTDNRVGDAGAQALLAALKGNTSLQRLELHNNDVAPDLLQALAQARGPGDSYGAVGDDEPGRIRAVSTSTTASGTLPLGRSRTVSLVGGLHEGPGSLNGSFAQRPRIGSEDATGILAHTAAQDHSSA